jgi:hypothetical protein
MTSPIAVCTKTQPRPADRQGHCRIFLTASGRDIPDISPQVVPVPTLKVGSSHAEYRLGGEDEQGCDAFVEIDVQGAED